MDKIKIDRINELARKARTTQLSTEELAEQDALRKEYVRLIRNNFERQLQDIVVAKPE